MNDLGTTSPGKYTVLCVGVPIVVFVEFVMAVLPLRTRLGRPADRHELYGVADNTWEIAEGCDRYPNPKPAQSIDLSSKE